MKKYSNPYAANTQKGEDKPEDPQNLHQGQGPDFITQDKTARKKNDALGETPEGTDFVDHHNVGEGDAELPPGGRDQN
ncbi:hypothetical protein [Pseudochryseolinea flava]|uniref:Uncharacterized protein n=1 Tax=Pseudochryseolinea flava TaxID=2059302 RepID=A0A364Y4A2_9BACT|nr:hypothetical protein [Pseudochryseolinea flava]RAW01780.1 hypothetical protein DQQ10_09035 [Pseudochryseolinea flava]